MQRSLEESCQFFSIYLDFYIIKGTGSNISLLKSMDFSCKIWNKNVTKIIAFLFLAIEYF